MVFHKLIIVSHCVSLFALEGLRELWHVGQGRVDPDAARAVLVQKEVQHRGLTTGYGAVGPGKTLNEGSKWFERSNKEGPFYTTMKKSCSGSRSSPGRT